MQDLLFLLNPKTAKTVMTPHLIDIVDVFQKKGCGVRLHVTQARDDARLTAAAIGSQFDIVVCAGGDGTLNETAAGLLEIPADKRPSLGYIPSGTTNDFAVSWGIPTQPMEAAQVLLQSDPLPLDVCLFRDKPYVYVAAFGAFTEVSYTTPQQMKQTLGWAAYLVEGIKSLSTLRSYNLHLEHDGGVLDGEFFFGMFSNTRSVGGFPLKQRDDISLSDGLMEVILVRKPENPLDNTRLIAAVLAQDTTSEFIEFLHTKHLRFSAREELPWTIDGEFGGRHTSGEITVIPSAIRMYL